MIRIDPDILEPTLEIAVIPSKWLCWLLGLCFVQGKLLKRLTIGGIPMDLPVCNATVEVYEVDPMPVIIPRLPDHIIERFREIIINPPPPPERIFPEIPPKGPIPPPPPPPPIEPFGMEAFSDMEAEVQVS